jgi:hypothetical protein
MQLRRFRDVSYSDRTMGEREEGGAVSWWQHPEIECRTSTMCPIMLSFPVQLTTKSVPPSPFFQIPDTHTHTHHHPLNSDWLRHNEIGRSNTATIIIIIIIIDTLTIKLSAKFDWILHTFFETVFVFCQSEPHILRNQFFSWALRL